MPRGVITLVTVDMIANRVEKFDWLKYMMFDVASPSPQLSS